MSRVPRAEMVST